MGWYREVNGELGDLADLPSPYNQPLFNFLRYDLKLEPEWLSRELGRYFDSKTVSKYRRLDAVENIPDLYALGIEAAERLMRREHLEMGSG